MGRDAFAGYLVEVDEERGTFALHSTWKRNLVDAIVTLAIIAFSGVWAYALLGCAWFGKPGIPVAQWRWVETLAFGALSAFLTVLGLAVLYQGVVAPLWKLTAHAVRGFPPSVLDRAEGRCREGDHTMFLLDRLESLRIAEQYNEDSVCGYVVSFHFRDGKPSEWVDTFSKDITSCETLGRAIARFLDVPITGPETPKKAHLPDL
jgi:hypothetical protein